MKTQGTTQIGYTENILDLVQANGKLKRMSRKLSIEQLKQLPDGGSIQVHAGHLYVPLWELHYAAAGQLPYGADPQLQLALS